MRRFVFTISVGLGVAMFSAMPPIFGFCAGVCAVWALFLIAEGNALMREDYENDHRDEWEGY